MTKKEEIISFVKNYIKDHNLKKGDKIISEPLLAEQLNTSRTTVRIALADLEKEGVIEKQHGKGTFIKQEEKKKKFILIVSANIYVEGNIKYIYRFFFKILNKYILDKGYKPIYFISDKLLDITSLSDTLDEIAGVVSFFGLEKDLEYIASHNIPILEVLKSQHLIYPFVILDHKTYYKEITNQINSINSDNILIFSINREKQSIDNLYNDFPFCFETELFAKYNIKLIDYFNSADNGEAQIVEALNSIKKKPNMVIFLDDNLFSITSDYFEEYPYIFKNTKILTQSNINWNYKENYNITRIQFDLYEVGKEAINTLDNIIHNKPLIKYNKLIKPKIITNEY